MTNHYNKLQNLWRRLMEEPFDVPPYNPSTSDSNTISLAQMIQQWIRQRIDPTPYSKISVFLDEYPGHLGRNLYTNGHFRATRKGKNLFVYKLFERDPFIISSSDIPSEDFPIWEQFFANPTKPLPRFVHLKSLRDRCFCCGEKITLETDGFVVRIKDPCKYPNGYIPWSVEVDVPSGTLLMGDYLDEYAPNLSANVQAHGQNYSSDTDPGSHQESIFYAMDNVLYGQCGNDCPGVYKIPYKDLYYVGNPSENDYQHERLKEATEKIGWINTNRWTFMFVDEQIAIQNNPEAYSGYRSHRKVQVRPGRYRMTYYRHRIPQTCLYNSTNSNVFATLERIGPCK